MVFKDPDPRSHAAFAATTSLGWDPWVRILMGSWMVLVSLQVSDLLACGPMVIHTCIGIILPLCQMIGLMIFQGFSDLIIPGVCYLFHTDVWWWVMLQIKQEAGCAFLVNVIPTAWSWCFNQVKYILPHPISHGEVEGREIPPTEQCRSGTESS